MIALLFICAVIAQETKNCGKDMYFNVNSGEGGKCEEVKNCKYYNKQTAENGTIYDGESDNFSGCQECEEGYFLFRGQCHSCNCGTEIISGEEEKIECTDGIGCPYCAKNHVMVEHKNTDGSVYYDCQLLPTERINPTPGILYSEYQLHGPDTRDFCIQWGKRGCTACGADTSFDPPMYYYVNASMCYPNTYCTEADEITIEGTDKKSYKCKNCTQGTKDELSYYLLEGVCTACDSNCTKCELSTGYCKECFPGYYPNGDNSKKCYQCDPNCDISGCVQLGVNGLNPGSCTKCREPDPSLNETYYLVANKHCIRMPASCAAAETDKGCVKCNPGYFLVRHDFDGNNFHYKIAEKRLGMCVPHQKACPLVNRTDEGCKGCGAGYVVDTITWTGDDGKSYSIKVCSGAMSVLIIALIAFLVLLF